MTGEHHHCNFDHLDTPAKRFKAYGVDLEIPVVRTKEFMERLIRSGIEPAYVALEGYRYATDLIVAYDTVFHHVSLRGDIASVITEEAAKRAGIHSDQLRAERESSG